jgi:hypothetical protein
MAEKNEDRARARRWALGWSEAAQVLVRMKKSELRGIDTSIALQRLARAFESCRIHFKPSAHSGLIEQQHWFRKLRQ